MFAEKNDVAIHTITLTADTNEAVDASFEAIDAVYRDVPEGTFVRFLYDASDTQNMPVKYALEQYKKYSFRNPRHQDSRMAVVLRPHLFMLAIASLSDANRNALRMTDNIRFYPANRADDARAWLMS